MAGKSPGQEIYDEAIKAGEIDWEGLLDFAAWLNSAELDDQERVTADQWNRRLVQLFKEGQGTDPDQTRVMLYGMVGGVYLSQDGHLQILVQNKNILFQWSGAQPLLVRADSLWQRALDWWPGGDVKESWLVGRDVQARQRQRTPHFLRAFDNATWILAAIYRENERCRASAGAHSSGDGLHPEPSKEFVSRLGQFAHHLDRDENELTHAFERDAQIRYGKGLMIGTALLAILCAAIGGIIALLSAPASYVIAVPAGGLGALLSVLQRMTKDDLHLDVAGNRELMWVAGALRPAVGAIFGIAVAALVAGGLSSTVDPPAGRELAFFGGLGFLAGFSERFAQDMLATSGGAKQGADKPRQTSDGGQPPSKPPGDQ